MNTKYVQCEVFHHLKGKFVPTDIIVEDSSTIVDEYPTAGSMYDKVIIPIENEFTASGILLRWPNNISLSDFYSQPDYVGTVDEIIQRVINENEL